MKIKNPLHKGYKYNPVTSNSYKSNFYDKTSVVISARGVESPVNVFALERAWKNRDFEIEMYWKRATYFWTFIGVSLLSYITFISSRNIFKFYQMEFLIICLGFFLSIVWLLANKGSKFWQENWEYHIDMLEDQVTGPLYKTVKSGSKYSVSKLNNLLNIFIIFIWGFLGVFYFLKHELWRFTGDYDWISWLIFGFTVIFTVIAFFQKTRKKSDGDSGFVMRERIKI